MTISGIDVSSVQGSIDWLAVARSGVRFAYIKCAQGNEGGVDPFYRANLLGARKAGVIIGPYHFGYPLPQDSAHPGRGAKEQAEAHFAKAWGAGASDGELPAALDIEWPAPDQWPHWRADASLIRDWGLEYLARYESLSGRLPAVYTYPYFWGKVLEAGCVGDYARYPLWLADYSHNPSPGVLPWGAPTLQQTSGGKSKKLPSGAPVDEDVFLGAEDAFSAFLSTGSQAITGH